MDNNGTKIAGQQLPKCPYVGRRQYKFYNNFLFRDDIFCSNSSENSLIWGDELYR